MPKLVTFLNSVGENYNCFLYSPPWNSHNHQCCDVRASQRSFCFLWLTLCSSSNLGQDCNSSGASGKKVRFFLTLCWLFPFSVSDSTYRKHNSCWFLMLNDYLMTVNLKKKKSKRNATIHITLDVIFKCTPLA